MKNLCFISKHLKGQLESSFNTDSHYINYTDETDESVVDSLDLSDLTRLAFIYHYPGYNSVPFFRDILRETDHRVKPTYKYFSDRLIELIRTVRDRSNNDLFVDLITCNLNKPGFATEIAQIESDLAINIRYSIDETGNNEHGGNWVMESDNSNIQDQYFTDEIENWTGVLNGTVNGSGNNLVSSTEATASERVLEVTSASGVTTIKLLKDIDWVGATVRRDITGDYTLTLTDYIDLADNTIFDGQGYTINMGNSSQECQGLFTTSGTSIADAPIIRNLNVTGGYAGQSDGFIVRYDQPYIKVENCSVTGPIDSYAAGGIAGGSFGKSGESWITNCISSGTIGGQSAGGIAGLRAGGSGICVITNCINIGEITGNNAGGITGDMSGALGKCSVIGCINTGPINTTYGGGIGGGYFGDYGKAIAIGCYNIGDGSGTYCGGIVGQKPSNNGHVVIANCYSLKENTTTGQISGAYSGYNYGDIIIYRCYSPDGSKNGTTFYNYDGGESDYYHGTHNIKNLIPEDINRVITLAEIQSYPNFGSFDITPPTAADFIWPPLGASSTKLMIEHFRSYPWGGYTEYNQIPTIYYGSNITLNDTAYQIGDNANFGVSDNTLYLLQNVNWTTALIVASDINHSLVVSDYLTLGAYSTFDGNGYTIDMTSAASDCEGIFASGASSYTEAPTIKNLTITNGRTADYGAFFLRTEEDYCNIINCNADGEIDGIHSGTIIGHKAGGKITIQKCYSSGPITGAAASGIIASMTANTGSIYIDGCYSTGDMSGLASSGIGGVFTGRHGKGYISNCYSTGQIGDGTASTDLRIGGIISNMGHDTGYCRVLDCYSTGNITSKYCGGIAASYLNGRGIIQNCYSLGNISGHNSAGICVTASDELAIVNCYATGTVSGSDSGEITATYPSHSGRILVSKTYSLNGLGGSVKNITPTDNETDSGTHALSAMDLDTINLPLKLADIQEYTGFESFGILPAAEKRRFISGTSGYPILKAFRSIGWSSDYSVNSDTPTILSSYSFNLYNSGDTLIGALTTNDVIKITDNKIELLKDITWTGTELALASGSTHTLVISDYIELGPKTVFDGNEFEIDMGSTSIDCYGLFSISSTVNHFVSAPTIQNLNITGGKTATDTGFILRPSQKFAIIQKCSSTGLIIGTQSGGIAGDYIGTGLGSRVDIIDCYSTGNLQTNASSGGIVGAYAGERNGECNIIRCYSTGNATNASAGLIAGAYAGYYYGNCNIIDCYSTGTISWYYSGGICGALAAYWYGNCKIIRCRSNGIISGSEAGGIVGKEAGHTEGRCLVDSCYSTGEIAGQFAGGIVGSRAGDDLGKCLIVNCYSLGTITEADAGGIVGAYAGILNGTCAVVNCYSTTTLDHIGAADSGEIAGSYTGDDNGRLLIHRCFSKSGTGGAVINVTNGGGTDFKNGTHDVDSMDIDILNNLYTVSDIQENTGFSGFVAEPPTSSPFKRVEHGLPIIGGFESYPWTDYALNSDAAILASDSNAIITLDNGILKSGGIFDVSDGILSLKRNTAWSGSLITFKDDSTQELTASDYLDLGENVVFNGNSKVISMVETECSGLFTVTASDFTDAPQIKNLGISGGTTAANSSFMLRTEQPYAKIEESWVGGEISGSDSGGFASSINGEISITNSRSGGNISGSRAGGLIGAGSTGTIKIEGSHSKGAISGTGAGGLVGGETVGSTNIYKSYSLGNITGTEAGGIAGNYCGASNGEAAISYCYTQGNISGSDCGGIVGAYAGSAGHCAILNCYTSGSDSGTNSGEITGYHTAANNGRVLIHKSYTKSGTGTSDINVTDTDTGANPENGTHDLDSINITDLNDIYTPSDLQDQTGFSGFAVEIPESITAFSSDTLSSNPKLTLFSSDPWTQYSTSYSIAKLGFTGDVIVNTNSSYNYLVRRQTGQDKILVLGKDSTDATYLNVYDNDLTVDRRFQITNSYNYHNDLVVDSSGNFAYIGAASASGAPRVKYYLSTASISSWETDLATAGSGHIVRFLKNDNLVVGTINTTSEAVITILSSADGSVVSEPTTMPTGSAVSSIEIVPYDDYFTVFWLDTGRYAARYSNSGTLQSQSSYLVSSDTGSGLKGTLIDYLDDQYPVLSQIDSNNQILLTLNNPLVTNNDGLLLYGSDTFSSDISSGPEITIINKAGSTGFISMYQQSSDLYYRSYRRNRYYSIEFGASDDGYINFDTNINMNNAFSLAAWIKPTVSDTIDLFSATNIGNINSWDHYDFSFNINGDGDYSIGQNLGFGNSSGNPYTPSQPGPAINEWNHIVATYVPTDGTVPAEWNFYLDGTFRMSRLAGIHLLTPDTIPLIFSGLNKFKGKVTDMKFYTEALSSDNVKTIFNNGSYTTNLAGWWLPSEGLGSDITSNGFGSDAFITNSANWSDDLPGVFTSDHQTTQSFTNPVASSGKIKISDLANAFPNLSDPYKLSSYRGILPTVPATGELAISDLLGKTASTPAHNFSDAYSGTNFSTETRNSNDELVRVIGKVNSTSKGAISFDLKDKIEGGSSYQGTLTYEVLKGMPSGFALNNGVLSASDIDTRLPPQKILVKCTNQYGNYSVFPIILEVSIKN